MRWRWCGSRSSTPRRATPATCCPASSCSGSGWGNIFAPGISSATYGAGVASAIVNTMQQVGGSIGTALLSSIFASAVISFAEGKPPSQQVAADAAMHGYRVALWVAAGVFAFGAVVVGLLMRSIKIKADAPAGPASEPQLARS